jgi:hypothetical protein
LAFLATGADQVANLVRGGDFGHFVPDRDDFGPFGIISVVFVPIGNILALNWRGARKKSRSGIFFEGKELFCMMVAQKKTLANQWRPRLSENFVDLIESSENRGTAPN